LQRIVTPIKEFIKDSRAIGIVLLTTTLLSIATANSNGYEAVAHILHQPLSYFKYLHLPESLAAWINDFLMGFYFLLIGLEIKRAFLIGELSSRKAAVAPIIAAIGGMLAPALIYYFITIINLP
jgi:NhaA family Na+:H+ antiporter